MRISWDEALNTIVAKIKEIGENYGPYSILGELPVLQWAGPWNFLTWGHSSFSGYILPNLVTLGYCQGNTAVRDSEIREYTDIFNTRLMRGLEPIRLLPRSAWLTG